MDEEPRVPAAWRRRVVDIRFGALKSLARSFFSDLWVSIPDRDLIPSALEFLFLVRDGNQRPNFEARKVLKRHPRLLEVFDDLHRSGEISYQMVQDHLDNTKKLRK